MNFSDTKQREKIILENLDLVKKIAKKIHRRLPPTVDLNDLISYGVLGLINAVDNLNTSKNPKAYLGIRIKGSIYDYLRNLDFGSRTVRDKEHKIKEAIETLEKYYSREPTDEEIANYLNVNTDELNNDIYKISFSHMLNLESFISNMTKGESDIIDNYVVSTSESPEDIAIKNDIREKVSRAVDKLSYKEKLVLQLLFYEDLTLKEVSEVLDISISRVSQIKSEALEKLKKYLEEEI